MGFFSKIFGGGKKSDTSDSKEIKTVSGGQKAVAPEETPSSKSVSVEPIPEEDRVPEPQVREEEEQSAQPQHKATVFGMPAPPFAGGAPAPHEPQLASALGEVVMGEAPMASGEVVMGEAPVASGEVVAGEAVVADEAEGGAKADAPAQEIAESAEPAASGTEAAEEAEPEMLEAEIQEPAAPPPLPAVEPERSGSGSRRILDEEPAAADDMELFPKAEKRDSRSSIDCSSCRRRLPVPYVGYPARITCPFCLTVNEYNM